MRKQNDADYARDWRPFQAALNVLVHAASIHSLSRMRTWRPYYFLRWPLVCSAFFVLLLPFNGAFLTALVLYKFISKKKFLNCLASILFLIFLRISALVLNCIRATTLAVNFYDCTPLYRYRLFVSGFELFAFSASFLPNSTLAASFYLMIVSKMLLAQEASIYLNK